MKTKREWGGLAALAAVVLLLLALVALLYAVGKLQNDSAAKGQSQLEESLYRASVSCYAVEGRYPPNVAYLQEHYGIQVDAARYTIFYEAFGDNLMPNITVLGK